MKLALARYETARAALAACVRVDECKDIRNKAVAVAAYAKQAQDRTLLAHATEIRLRAERRAGVILAAMAKRGERAIRKNMKSQLATSKLRDLGVNKTQSSRWQKLAFLADDEFEQKIALAKHCAVRATMLHIRDPGLNWNAAPEWIKRARRVMGGIDCDPATNDAAQRQINAAIWHTIKTDGLAHEWRGRVWLNPPYATEKMMQFAAKLIEEIAAGRVTQAIVLSNNRTDTPCFQRLARDCAAMCFPRGRIKFQRGTESASPQGSAFFYFGKNVAKFKAVFDDAGFVARLA